MGVPQRFNINPLAPELNAGCDVQIRISLGLLNKGHDIHRQVGLPFSILSITLNERYT